MTSRINTHQKNLSSLMCISIGVSTWLDISDFTVHLTSSQFTISCSNCRRLMWINRRFLHDSSSIHITTTFEFISVNVHLSGGWNLGTRNRKFNNYGCLALNCHEFTQYLCIYYYVFFFGREDLWVFMPKQQKYAREAVVPIQHSRTLRLVIQSIHWKI
jgi:hypothetical protein